MNYVECHSVCHQLADLLTYATLAENRAHQLGKMWRATEHRRLRDYSLATLHHYHNAALPLVALQVTRALARRTSLVANTTSSLNAPEFISPMASFRRRRSEATQRGASPLALESWPPNLRCAISKSNFLRPILGQRFTEHATVEITSLRRSRDSTDSGCESDVEEEEDNEYNAQLY